MLSAYVPKHYPPEIMYFMNTRGSDKVMFATDYPVLSFKRCMKEVKEIAFRNDEIRRKFLRENALRVFNWDNKKRPK
jgi:predicted TIM-barrel fold metal-dependent hydrolase